MSYMRLLILGGTGYLGRKVLERLVEEGHSMLCITRRDMSCLNIKQVEYCKLGEHLPSLKEFRPEIFLNMACCYLRNGKTEQDVLEANFCVPAKMLQDVIECGCKRCITIGTSLPDEFSIYSYSKHMFAELGKWYVVQKEIDFINVRLENFYGEDEPMERFLPSTINKLLKNEDILLTEGFQKRDFIYIKDVVENILALIRKAHLRGMAEIPLGTGDAPSIREIVKYLHEISNSKSRLLFGSVPMRKNEPNTVADVNLMKEYEIEVEMTWKRGMELLVEEIKKNSREVSDIWR